MPEDDGFQDIDRESSSSGDSKVDKHVVISTEPTQYFESVQKGDTEVSIKAPKEVEQKEEEAKPDDGNTK